MEVIEAEPLVPMLILRRLDDTVDGGLVIATREIFGKISTVDDLRHDQANTKPKGEPYTYQGIVYVFDEPPFAIVIHDLQSSDRLTPQCCKTGMV